MSDNEDSDYESSYVEEEEEAKLKYQRIGTSVLTILKEDTALRLIASSRYLVRKANNYKVLVTLNGLIYVLDFNGNEIKQFQQPNSTISDVSVDEAEEFIATCSKDGKVFIYNLCDFETQTFVYKSELSCIAIDPQFSKNSNKQFLIGGENGKLIMHEKGWLGTKDNILHSGEGSIYTIKWFGNLIAWANEIGIKVYDCSTMHKISHVARPKSSGTSDKINCHLTWKENNYLLMAWGSSIKIGLVKEKPKMEVAPGWPSRFMEIVGILECDYVVCGIIPFFNEFAVLAYSVDTSSENTVANRPEVRLIQIDGEELSSDALSITNFEELKAKDYRLVSYTGENQFYIQSPKEIILCKPRDLDDHITWLLERNRFEEALVAAEKGESERCLSVHTVVDVGQKYMNFLLAKKEYQTTAIICSRVLKQDAALWENWVFTFAELRILNVTTMLIFKLIAPFVPVSNPKLSDTVYEMILAYFLNHDKNQLWKLLSSWPLNIYNVDNVTSALEDFIERLSFKSNTAKSGSSVNSSSSSGENGELGNESLMNSLAYLYEKNIQYDKAVKYYLLLKQDKVFDLIDQHDMFYFIKTKVLLLMKFHEPEEITSLALKNWRKSKSIQLLTNNTTKIPISDAVAQLKSYPKYLHVYLDALFEKDAHIASNYHHLQVELYADYDYSRLSEFLRASNEYPLEKALEMCQKRNLIPEMVFILGRMGNTKKALKFASCFIARFLQFDDLGLDGNLSLLSRFFKAIEFAKEHNDEELWNELVMSSLDKPEFICGLLENIGVEINPVKIVGRIPKKLEIPNLKSAILKVLNDYNLQESLLVGCQAILNRDCISLLEKLHKEQIKGEAFYALKSDCGICNRMLGEGKHLEIISFNCKHHYHVNCISISEKEKETSSAAAAMASAITSTNANTNTTATSSSQNTTRKKGLWQFTCPQCQ